MKTETRYVYWTPNEYTDDGISLIVQKTKNDDSELFKFVCELEMPVINQNEVVEANVSKLDSAILDKQKEILGLEEKKAQLLALPCGGE